MIAIALALRPKLLIADEPTTALDVTVQAQILGLIRDLQRHYGAAVILITHDMGVVAEMADRVVVMHEGRIVEEGPVGRIFAEPEADYTRTLLSAVPRLGAMNGKPIPPLAGKDKASVVDVSGLTVRFDVGRGYFRKSTQRIHAVEGIGFRIEPGETFALVGESGCGKSTTGRALLDLVRWQGDIRIAGTPTAGLGRTAMKAVRREIQMIFQDPYASLDPRMTVGELVGEPLVVHRLARGSDLRDRVASLFHRVGLSPDQMRRHPHEFSGGQRQRICIARALALSPKVIVADESVSALDVSVQARVLDLLRELQEDLGISYLFISHDMAVVEKISRRVAVMKAGQIVEMGTRAQVFENPLHPYTRQLLDAVPVPDPRLRKLSRSGAMMDSASVTPAIGAGVVRLALRNAGDGHLVAS
jgi:peptide/nickel transport system ATP-binding protein